MSLIARFLIAVVALEHLYFLYVEMFRWTSAATQKAFGITAEFAQASQTLAANQGLYNGFLAAGLVWALLEPAELGKPVATFFAACVLIAGIFGGLTVVRRIFFVQALPAALAILAVVST
jgi:putative membrane protein